MSKAQGGTREAPRPDPPDEVRLLLGVEVNRREVVRLAGPRAHVYSFIWVPSSSVPVLAAVDSLDGSAARLLVRLLAALLSLLLRLPVGLLPHRLTWPCCTEGTCATLVPGVAHAHLPVPEGPAAGRLREPHGSGRTAEPDAWTRFCRARWHNLRRHLASDRWRRRLHGVPEVNAIATANAVGLFGSSGILSAVRGRRRWWSLIPWCASIGLHRHPVASLACARADVDAVIGVPPVGVPIGSAISTYKSRGWHGAQGRRSWHNWAGISA
mmetsp:Transcript_24166/g.75896  ORF Transcript_24166/g.75896 Transcript_24166/m.75896 type:complete len:269 (-) Transcript_24166:2-808(-)